MPSLAFRKASICSRFSFSASCTLVVNPQHATRSRLILYWKLPPPSGSSCIGKDSDRFTGWSTQEADKSGRALIIGPSFVLPAGKKGWERSPARERYQQAAIRDSPCGETTPRGQGLPNRREPSCRVRVRWSYRSRVRLLYPALAAVLHDP